MPDIRLQKPAITVASITMLKRRSSRRRPRMVLRMMMKGAAKASSGTAAKVAGRGPSLQEPEARRPPGHGLIAGGEHAGERKAERKREEGLNLFR